VTLATKELGQTENPKELVPGEPGQVRTAGQSFTDEATHMSDVRDQLARCEAPAWEGGAAEQFRSGFRASLTPWSDIAQITRDAGSALRDHAEVLGNAQDKAQQAIDKYREGQRAQERALAAHNAAVDAYNSAISSPGRVGGGGGTPTPPGEFHDPGIGMMEEAQQILADARQMVTDSAGTATTALNRLSGDSSADASDFAGVSASGSVPVSGGGASDGISGDDLLSAISGEGGGELAGDEVGDSWQTYGPEGNQTDILGYGAGYGVEATENGLEANAFAEAYLAKGEYGAEGDLGPGSYSANGEFRYGYGAEANATVGPDGVAVDANVSAGLTAEGDASYELGPASVGVEGSGVAGAQAGVDGSIDATGVHAGAEAVAGLQGEVGANGEIGGVGGGVTAEGIVGAGASAEFDAGMNDDGSFTIGASASAALGIGGGFGFEVTVDPSEVADTANDIADGIGEGVSDLGDGIGDAASGLGDALGI